MQKSIKKFAVYCVIVVFALLFFALLMSSRFLGHELTRDRPNIIVIFSDDQGWADLGVQDQADDVQTPHLDTMAAEGVRFTSGYVTAPQCSPSRAGLLTGRYQQRYGYDEIRDGPMPFSEITIADRLSDAGYTTGMVGKWHLEPNKDTKNWAQSIGLSPDENGSYHIPKIFRLPYTPPWRGFDDYFMGGMNTYFHNYNLDGSNTNPLGDLSKIPGFRIDIQTEAALAFIDRRKDDSFFLYLAYMAPHVPLEAPEKYLARFSGEMPTRRRYALAMMAAMDDGVGRLRARLDQLELSENTLIFYISDNGAPLAIDKRDAAITDASGGWDGSLNTPLNGEKGTLLEGGIRVPFIAAWKSKIAAGQLVKEPVSTLDVAATGLAVSGEPEEPLLDGVNLMPTLTSDAEMPGRALFWRFWGQAAVREGSWKLLKLSSGERFLFNLEEDLGERKNLLNDYPKISRALEDKLMDWSDSMLPVGLPQDTLNRQEQAWFRHYLELER